MYTYTGIQWILFFYFYCFAGWCIESTIVSFNKKKLVNRGFLRGPLLPIYGSGAIMVLICSLPVKDYIVMVYLLGMTGATILEYITGWLMEAILKVRYWDYSNDFMNLNGYISLKSSLFWGVLSIFMTYIVHEPVSNLILSMDEVVQQVIAGSVSIVFAVDVWFSAKAALDLAKYLEKIKSIREELDSLAVQLKKNAIEFGEETRQEISERIVSSGIDLESRIERLKEEKNVLIGRLDYLKKSLIQSNPSATSRRFSGTLEEIRERLEIQIKERIKKNNKENS